MHNLKPNQKIASVMELTTQFCENFPAEHANKLFQHVEKEENKFREYDRQGREEIPICLDDEFAREELNAEPDADLDDE
jgi:flavin reductase (DIM6/NTAB) family NADH-FMN oxidoreductase RutF